MPVADRPGEQVIKFHRIGEDPGKDRLVVEKIGDPTTFQDVELSIDGHWLVRTVSHGWRSTDVSFRDARDAGSPWTTLVAGKDAIYDVDVFRDRFYVGTNEGAPNRRVFAVDPAHPDRASWREIVPERKDATLESKSLIGGNLAECFVGGWTAGRNAAKLEAWDGNRADAADRTTTLIAHRTDGVSEKEAKSRRCRKASACADAGGW